MVVVVCVGGVRNLLVGGLLAEPPYQGKVCDADLIPISVATPLWWVDSDCFKKRYLESVRVFDSLLT